MKYTYLIKDDKIIAKVINVKDSDLVNGVRIATEKEINKYELENLRQKTIEEVNKVKTELETFLEWNDKVFEINEKAQISFLMYVSNVENIPETIKWVLANNQNVEISKEDFMQIYQNGIQQITKARLNRQPIIEKIKTMSKKEIETIDIKLELLK